VFDEVYYPKYGSHYLQGIPLFGGHPPLSTYFMAFGIWVATHTPIGQGEAVNSLTGMLLTPVSYRWFDAVTGSFMPLLMVAIAHLMGQLAGWERSRCRSFGLIAGLFAGLDGLLLVETRYALINIFLVLFGFLAQLWLLLALRNGSHPQATRWKMVHRHLYLALTGICLAATTSIKWNGLGFWFGLMLLIGMAWIVRLWQAWRGKTRPSTMGDRPFLSTFLGRITQIHPLSVVLYFVVVPAIAYWLFWLPYLQLTPQISFWDWQKETLAYHGRIGGHDSHPYCSYWWGWPLLLRPIAYFYATGHTPDSPPTLFGPALPGDAVQVIYDIHALGNPILWWFSTAAIAYLIGRFLFPPVGWVVMRIPFLLPLRQWLQSKWAWLPPSPAPLLNLSNASVQLALYLVLNYAANWLPWMIVHRCTLLYLYMPASLFALLAIAWFASHWWHSSNPPYRAIALTVIGVIAAAFLFWLPLYLALPLSREGFWLRMWFPSWL
jgi:dolichyl-phosphate-mannose--protein O-mannosyl transferase